MKEAPQLFDRIAQGDREGLRTLLDADPDQASSRNPQGISALMWAKYHRHDALI